MVKFNCVFLQCYKLHYDGTVPFCVLFICMWYYHSCFYHALLKSFCNKTLSIPNFVASIFLNCYLSKLQKKWYNFVNAIVQGFADPKSKSAMSHCTKVCTIGPLLLPPTLFFGVIKYIITETTNILFYKWRIVCHRLVLFTYIDISITYPVLNPICFHLNHYTWQAYFIFCIYLYQCFCLSMPSTDSTWFNTGICYIQYTIHWIKFKGTQHRRKSLRYDYFVIVQSLIL